MSERSEARQKAQASFIKSGKELSVGDTTNLPMSVEQLCGTTGDSPWVQCRFGGGLTAEVFKIEAGGKFYTLKKKRETILVSNIDGQTSFLNEVQRRRDFEALKKRDPESYAGVIDTIYASLTHGIILSPWIEGGHINAFTSDIVDQIFFTLISMEIGGIFEYDPTAGNFLLTSDGRVMMYDFGYAYPFDPATDYNADGTDVPIFHCAERFETRCFMQHLMDVEDCIGKDKMFELYRMEKTSAIAAYERKLRWLGVNGGKKHVVEAVMEKIDLWKNAFFCTAELERVYALESFRSYVLDLHDDLGGRSCTPDTLKKADRILSILETDYGFLKDHNGFFWGDETQSQSDLLAKYRTCRKNAEGWQIAATDVKERSDTEKRIRKAYQ